MKTRICFCCGKEIAAEDALHCERCGKCYCQECAKKLALCECASELSFYN